MFPVVPVTSADAVGAAAIAKIGDNATLNAHASRAYRFIRHPANHIY